ncbi:MAG TPA: hypothetical protein PLN52_01545 [Opitutaceae bacterium]|nr:hypothetical protein [Opitutaceae bacterium]
MTWDAGVEKKNEWVYASLESAAHKSKLLDWLRSKGVDEKEEALWFDPGWTKPRRIFWRDILKKPEEFFSDAPFQAVSLDLSWVLSYMNQGVARFGRWQKEEPIQLPEPMSGLAPGHGSS